MTIIIEGTLGIAGLAAVSFEPSAALPDVNGGVGNSAFGNNAMSAGTVTTKNAAFGENALADLTTGNGATVGNNCAFGAYALAHGTAIYDNTAVGEGAMDYLITGYKNVAIGHETMLGDSVGLTSAFYQCTAVGDTALRVLTTGHDNTACGWSAGFVLTTGIQDTFVGSSAALSATTGNNNTCIGFGAGYNPNGTPANAMVTGATNTYIGANTGSPDATDPSNCTSLGYNARATTNATAIGAGARAAGNGSVTIGVDNTGAAANTGTANNFVLGTALHTVRIVGNAVLAGATGTLSFYGGGGRVQPAAIAAPAGGATVDTQARAAITSILAVIGAAAGGVGLTA